MKGLEYKNDFVEKALNILCHSRKVNVFARKLILTCWQTLTFMPAKNKLNLHSLGNVDLQDYKYVNQIQGDLLFTIL